MADAKNKNLNVGVGFSVTDSQGGLQKLAENITKINSGGKELATSLAEVEKAIKKVLDEQGKLGDNAQSTSQKQKQATQGTLSELQRVQKQYDNNLIDAQKYYNELIKLEQQYSKEVNSNKEGSKEYDQALKNLDAVKKAREKFNNELGNQEKAYTQLLQQEEKIRLAEEKQVQQQMRAEAKATATQQKQALKEVTSSYKQAASERKKAFSDVNSAFATKKLTGNNMLTSMLGFGAINSVTSELQNLGIAISDINYNAINNQRLMGNMSTQLRDELNSAAADIARNTGILISDAQEIQGAWIRINDEYAKSPKLLNEMTRLTSEFMNVGEVEDAEQAVKLVNASMLQLGLSASDSTQKIANAKEMLNKWSYMADKTAMGTADEYGEAISKFGSAITTLGGDLDDAMVLTSVAADYLAKNGKEAGNSLKTFVQYLNRPKTVTLFNEISKDLGDTKYQLVDAKGEFKSFAEMMEAASDAYNKYMKMGNEQQARKIVEALGATRQSDVSSTILKNWQGEAQTYYNMLDDVANKGNYLEEQSKALMSTLRNQFNSLVVTLQQVGMAFANSGILTGLTEFMKIGGSLLSLITKLPTPLLTVVSALVAFKTGVQGLNKLGEVTGIADKLWKSLYSGTQAQIDNALATQKNTEAFLNQQEMMFNTVSATDKLTESYMAQLNALQQYQMKVAANADAFATGNITAEQYAQELERLKVQYQENVAAIAQNVQGTNEYATANKIASQSTKEATVAENANNSAKSKKLTSLLKEKITMTANNGLKKIGISITKEDTIADKASAIAKSLVSKFTNEETAGHVASTVAKGAETVATTLLTGAMTLLGTAISFVTSPMFLLTAGMMVLSGIFSSSSSESEKLQTNIDDLTNSINESKERVQELKDQQQRSGLSGSEQQELDYLEQKIELEEKALKLKQQEKDNDDFIGNHHIFLGFGGSDNTSEKIDEVIKNYTEAKTSVDSFSDAIKRGSASEDELNMWNEQLSKSNKKLASSSADVVTQYNYLKKGIEQGKWSGDALEKAQEQMKELEGFYKDASKSVEEESQKMAESTSSINDVDFSQSEEQIKNFTNLLKQSADDIKTLLGGTATNEDLVRMAESYEGFATVIGKSTTEQIQYIRDFRKNAAQEEFDEIDKQIETAQTMYDKAYKAIQDLQKEGVKKNSDEYKAAEQELQDCIDKLSELKSMKDFRLNIEVDANGVQAANDKLQQTSTTVEALNDLFKEYNKNGYLSGATIQSTLKAHEDFAKYLVKEGNQYKLNTLAVEDLKNAKKEEAEATDQLIEGLQNEQNRMNSMSAEMKQYMQSTNEYIDGIQGTFKGVEGVNKFTSQLKNINDDFTKGKTSAQEFSKSLNDLINNTNFDVLKAHANDTSKEIENLDEKTKNALQSQQAMFSTLASEIAGYQQDITQSLQNGTISVSEYMSALQSTNTTLLDLYTTSNNLTLNEEGKWENAAHEVDEYANSLQNAIDTMKGMPEVAEYVTQSYDQMSLAAQNNAIVDADCANSKTAMAWWASNEGTNAGLTMYDNFASTMGALDQTNHNAWQSVVNTTAQATGLTQDQVIAVLQGNATNSQQAAQVVGAGTSAMMGLVGNAAQRTTNAAGKVFQTLGNMIKSFNYKLSFGVKGGISPGGNILDLLQGKKFTPKSDLQLTIKGSGGSSVNSFANSLSSLGSSLQDLSIQQYLSSIKAYKPTTRGSKVAPSLSGSSYSPAPVTGSSHKGSSGSGHKGSSGKGSSGKGSSGKTQAEKDAEAAAKAAKEAAKASKEAAEAIEKLTNEYISNVESMYDRIAKALKAKYQEQYDERKKLLEKEHNERVDQIQAEIDALKGERPEDKNKQLETLKNQLEKWKKDDSSLGKSKQKEYMDKIADLEKEIKLDELQDKLDKENEDFNNSVDKESEFYDAILKKLDEQMTDQMLYAEARDMIVEGKQQEIIDLLTKYDANWSGWATLMGQTAGDVIAQEVKVALANYLDVIKGTIGTNGGYHTNKVTGGSSSSSSSSSKGSSSSGSSSSGSVSKGGRVRITDTSAGMYYTSTSKSAVNNWRKYTGTYYVVNDKAGRVALAKSNNVRAAIGWIDKSKVVGASTGTYTGNQEGIAMLHKKERVLSAAQTKAFDDFVYRYLPKIDKKYTTVNDTNNKTVNTNQFNAPITQINVEKVVNNTQADIRNTEDNLARAVKKSLAKSGIKPKR